MMITLSCRRYGSTDLRKNGRTITGQHKFHCKACTFDTFGPLGPVLVTADEVPDPHNLDLRVTIGDDVLQSSNTRHLLFTIPQLIAYLSAVMTLESGDVIATGTPAGVGGHASHHAGCNRAKWCA